MTAPQGNPSLVVALAMLIGTVSQLIAHHLKIPGIVLFLLAGVFFGPEVLGWVQPSSLGFALESIVGFAVAIILFEGGMVLNLHFLRRQGKNVQRLIFVGALLTPLGGAFLAHFLMGWSWTLSLLFGTLVIVTGPTVITPIVSRINLQHNLGTILEAEGIFIDALGASIAIVALELVFLDSSSWLLPGAWGLFARLSLGGILGVLGGLLVRQVLHRWSHWVPEGLENVLIMSFAFALFEGTNMLVSEGGITAVIIAGLLVGESNKQLTQQIKDFKGQIAALLIPTLFVLLSANVKIAGILALGWQGLLVVFGLMFLVRPLVVLLSFIGSDLKFREKIFLSWLAPRGIVAAAVASLFAHRLHTGGIAGGDGLYSLVFLVIAITVILQGLSGGWVANKLGLQRTEYSGTMFLGANALARLCALALEAKGEEVILVDTNAFECQAAEEEGLKVIYGNALEDAIQRRAYAGSRGTFVGLTPNDTVNLLFANKMRQKSRISRILVAYHPDSRSVSKKVLDESEIYCLFGQTHHISRWLTSLNHNQVSLADWLYTPIPEPETQEEDEAKEQVETKEEETKRVSLLSFAHHQILPLVYVRDEKVSLFSEEYEEKEGDVVRIAIQKNHFEDVKTTLETSGWSMVCEVPCLEGSDDILDND
ncbi:MAG: hypothetical protein CL920_31270 [Deltaproteobacteria bacterium]|nr:hypothetical protein [Deltaproteobacteria bacterium]|tara:strand:+ start:338 stop:2293 length:1956 start_codon:yes stop_codon:yes gene_type:complete